jgi:molecular chaperone GrpE
MEDLEVAPELETPAIVESTVDPLTELQAELDQIKDQFLRSRAETENIRRRSMDESIKARKFAIESFAEHLIPVADSLYAALDHAEADSKAGLEVILNQLKSAFEKSNLIEINPIIGSEFDPHKHQAIATVESEQPTNTIVTVLQRGYSIADRVLRPTMVSVSKDKEEKSIDTAEDNK